MVIERALQVFTGNTGNLVFASIFFLLALGIIILARGIWKSIVEGAAIRKDAAALVSGELMWSEKNKRQDRVNNRRIGLRIKLTSLTFALVAAVAAMVSLPLYTITIRTKRQALLHGLWQSSIVLLDAAAAGARACLSQGRVSDLEPLLGQWYSIPQASYITISGDGPGLRLFEDLVLATNDPGINEKIDTTWLQHGVSRLTDTLSPRLHGIAEGLNNRASHEFGGFCEEIRNLSLEEQSLVLRTGEADIRNLALIREHIHALEARVNEGLIRIERGSIGTEPLFPLDDLRLSQDHSYIFYRPIMYFTESEDVFFRGLVRLEVSVESIMENIAEEKKSLLRLILILTLAGAILSSGGALVLSNRLTTPIMQISRHIEAIRDTSDMTRLGNTEVRVNSHDELGILGNTINEMTHSLVKAAEAASDLSTGKEIQKKLLPLELDREGNKHSYGIKNTDYISFFGYYEGARGVSGDYFDYHDLDGRYCAIIKCDVAGKGIAAAFIMIQVATMFRNYCKNWQPTEEGFQIEDLVYQINDFIESLSFKDRFAAFTLCLFDSHTGTARYCNAGDNIIRLYDASEKWYTTLTLPETPAAGVLPNYLVESIGGYTVQTLILDHGDMLLFYTDGIEEARRKFRDRDFREIRCGEGVKDTQHENHTAGQEDEEMGKDRIQAIINAVMNKQIYTLHKWHNGEGEGNDLQFDFSTSESSVEDVIMAMVSVEKMFRCYKDPKVTRDDRVLVDKIVDLYLREYFKQYRNYCSSTQENPGNPAYMYYTYLKEDEQYDDLTILGIKRN